MMPILDMILFSISLATTVLYGWRGAVGLGFLAFFHWGFSDSINELGLPLVAMYSVIFGVGAWFGGQTYRRVRAQHRYFVEYSDTLAVFLGGLALSGFMSGAVHLVEVQNWPTTIDFLHRLLCTLLSTPLLLTLTKIRSLRDFESRLTLQKFLLFGVPTLLIQFYGSANLPDLAANILPFILINWARLLLNNFPYLVVANGLLAIQIWSPNHNLGLIAIWIPTALTVLAFRSGWKFQRSFIQLLLSQLACFGVVIFASDFLPSEISGKFQFLQILLSIVLGLSLLLGLADSYLRTITLQKLSARQLHDRTAEPLSAHISLTESGHISTWSQKAIELFGYQNPDIIGKHVRTLSATGSRFPIEDLNIVRQGMHFQGTGRFQKLDGSVFQGSIFIGINPHATDPEHAYAVDISDLSKEGIDRGTRENILDLLSVSMAESKSAAWSINPQTQQTWKSENFEALLGYTQLVTENPMDAFLKCVIPSERDRVKSTIDVALVIETVNTQTVILPQNGEASSPRNISLTCKTILNAIQEPVQILCVIQDITETLATQNRLRKNEIRLKELMRLAPVGIYLTDTKGNCTFVNDSWIETTGMTFEVARDLNWSSSIHDHDRNQVIRAWNYSVDTFSTFDLEFRYVKPDGSVRWVQGNAIPLFDHEGNLEGYLGVNQDITEMRAALEQSQFLRSAMDRVNLVTQTDAHGKITDSNRRFQDISGFTANEVLGQDHRMLNSGLMPEGFFRSMWDTIRSGQPWQGDICNRRRDGSLYWVDTHIIPQFESNGKIKGYISIRHDITDRVLQKQELDSAVQKAETANRAKSAFLANMSHEIRTPLNGILGVTDLLIDSNPSEEQAKFLKIIQQSGRSLLSIINDILDFSKIEAGKISFERNVFSLIDFVEQEFQLLRLQAEEKGISLNSRIDPQLPSHVIGDISRLSQVFLNLLGNSIKFTHKGGVSVSAYKIPNPSHKSQGVWVRFEVQDTGIGMTKEEQSKLFKAFSQANDGTNRKYGGTGLGLSISKLIIENMGGTIGLSSEKDQGSTFWFEIPFEIGKAPTVPMLRLVSPDSNEKNQTPASQNFRVLVADDVSANQLLTSKMLEKLGYRHAVVSNGQEAIDAVQRESFDLILMDCQMPEVDGYEATRIIRKNPDPKINSIIIIALTANAMADDARICIESGMNDYLSKPITKNALGAMLARWLTHKHKSAS